MRIGDKPRRITRDSYQEVNPVWSPDGKQIAYSPDRAGTEDIYVRHLRSGQQRRVTALPSAEVSASFSPDEKSLAFQDEKGATYVLDLASGDVRELVTPLFGPGRPTWSADSKTLAFASVRPYSQRFREGVSQILVVDVATGAQRYVEPGDRHASLSTRGDDGPVWSPDGRRMAFVMGSQLHVMPVDATGTPTGSPKRVNSEVADAPSWSGDSRKLLYLSQGRLRLASARTGKARTVDVPLRYRPDVRSGRQVVHAGRFWDGQAKKLRRDVDITVVDNRIRNITPHRPHRSGKVVDASGLTVMPGLMDSHVHQAYESRFFGDRQGRVSLAWGITSTLSVGDQVYRAMEDRDSLRAGARVGPRFYATGLVDGSRVYYNFMRPTRSDAQVRRRADPGQAAGLRLREVLRAICRRRGWRWWSRPPTRSACRRRRTTSPGRPGRSGRHHAPRRDAAPRLRPHADAHRAQLRRRAGALRPGQPHGDHDPVHHRLPHRRGKLRVTAA